MTGFEGLRVALVHDWLVTMGGAEKVLWEMHTLFPDAPIYTAVHDPEGLPPAFRRVDIRPSFLQRIPGAIQRHRAFLPLHPLAFEALDLTGYDLILSSSHACAKGIIPGPEALHLSYVHTPLRYAWDMYHTYVAQQQISVWKQALMHPMLHYLRLWDRLSADRVDGFASNSAFVAARIAKYYRRPATVIHPPVAIPDTPPSGGPRGDFYLLVSRFVPYKRLDLAIRVCSQRGLALKVVGDGPEGPYLRSLAGPTVTFCGAVSDAELHALYRQAKGLIFPGLEDFGIVPVEAQAYGCPVIALGQGGARETVIDGVTGLFFDQPTPESLGAALQRFGERDWDVQALYTHARRFAPERFRAELLHWTQGEWSQFQQGRGH